MIKNNLFFLIIIFFLFIPLKVKSETFEQWKISFSDKALSEGVSKKTLLDVINNIKFLPKVIEYDRYQPEFYEDTFTYINKRTGKKPTPLVMIPSPIKNHAAKYHRQLTCT